MLGLEIERSLAWSQDDMGLKVLRVPDAVGNLFKTPERKERKYGPAGQLEARRRCRWRSREQISNQPNSFFHRHVDMNPFGLCQWIACADDAILKGILTVKDFCTHAVHRAGEDSCIA